MSEPAKPRRASISQLVLLLAVAFIAWQGAQAVLTGTIGLPGVYVVSVTGQTPSAVVENPRTKPPELGKAWRKVKDTPASTETKPASPPTSPAPKAEKTEPAFTPPGEDTIKSWFRGTAQEFLGGVDAEGIPLYRFDVWLEMPDDIREHTVSAAYTVDAPSAQPPAQTSKDAKTGFRIRFGGAACAKTIALTLTFADGKSRDVEVEGCSIIN